MNSVARKQATKSFVEFWEGKGYEKGQTQSFWLSLLRDVLGVEHPEQVISFEDQVKMDHTSFMDGHIPDTHVLIEQKSLGKDLDAPIRQSDGALLNPFQQAKRYSAELPYDDRPRWIVTCNFEEFRIYDMNLPNDPPEVVRLADLEKEAHRLQFLVDAGSVHVRRELEISLEAGEIVGRIYEALRKQYVDPDSSESQHSLNVLCVRLVFCLYSENAGIFGRYGMFHDFLVSRRNDARTALLQLFEVLDQPVEERNPYLAKDLAAFPYVNGGLFREQVEVPLITPEIVDLILHKASEGFNWRDISPTIFGSIFESTLNPETRREQGMHYTSVENIRKVIDPLFLDDLRAELEAAKAYKQAKTRRKHLAEFRHKLASLKFLDPACGSGNFLTEGYLALRRLENEAIRIASHDNIGWEAANPIEVSISQFAGIESNDFACTVAQTALWIAEAQALQETEAILAMEIDYLPLTTAAHIHRGNALRADWNEVIPASEVSYVMGNPPFGGYTQQTKEQKADLQSLEYALARNVDYVAGWYFKAAGYMRGTHARAAFVSTNSICQGEQVVAIWRPLLDAGVRINFAYTTFRWDSEASSKAHVHVVIVGFSMEKDRAPRIYTGSAVRAVRTISPYLVEAPTVFIERRKDPLCDVPRMMRGNQPTDGGNLILTEIERDQLLEMEPSAAQFIRPFMMGKDFIDRKPRYCLWLVGANPSALRKCPAVLERIEAVRECRMSSRKAATRRKADTPMLFDEIRPVSSDYIAVPEVSSERRRYIPIDYVNPDVVAGNKIYMVPDATLYHFGVLTSNVHMAWMRATAGRLEMRYCYSNTIVYNNFPWMDVTPAQKARIEGTARSILDARALYPDASLADLYDEVAMPAELRKAHQMNDREVMRAYGLKPGTDTEAECVELLMRLYKRLVDKA